VNLFVASELDWEEKGMRVRQDTTFPRRGETLLTIRTAKRVPFALHLREPYWTDGKMAAALNGKPVTPARTNGYWVIDRFWENGDELRVSLPMKLHAHPMPDDDTLQAIMYGPVVLAGDLGSEGLTEAMRRGGGDPPELTNPAEAPEFVAPSGDPASWIAPADKPLVFQIKGQSRDIRMLPLNYVVEQRYGVYWRVKAKEA